MSLVVRQDRGPPELALLRSSDRLPHVIGQHDNLHLDGFQDNPAASVLPFIEQMGTWTSTMSKEFWWEREWRHLGDFDFGFDSLSLVLCPERDIEEFSAMTRFPVIDPSWSLERIISRLAALAAAD